MSAEPIDLPVLGSLSPSRAGDFMTCPLLFRYRTIDRLPQAPSSAATRGTVVHSVLERLFDLPAAERTIETAAGLLRPEWEKLVEAEPEVACLFEDGESLTVWLDSARELLANYFTLEDPTRVEPAERERLVEVVLPGGLRLRGIVDRLDVAPTGEVRVVDYKGLALHTPLPTPSGWTTMGDVAVGDELLGSQGRPCRVLSKSQVHHRPCFEVVFTDGTRVVCDNVHLWSVHIPSGDGYHERVVDAMELERLVSSRPSTVRGRRRLFVRAAAPVDLPAVKLPIDPWLLGAWLGDGSVRSGELTVGHDDREDMLTLLKQHWPGEVRVEPWSESSGALAVNLLRPRPELCPNGHDDWRTVIRSGTSRRRCTHESAHAPEGRWNAAFSELLSREGMTRNKHVPAVYLRGSHAQRLSLLQGLMDTDGSWNGLRNRAVFVTTTAALADAVAQLVYSLGTSCTRFGAPYESVRGGRVAFRVEFRPAGFNPFTLPRKATLVDLWASARRAPLSQGVPRELRRTIAAVHPIPSVPTQCVEVDAPDSLYL